MKKNIILLFLLLIFIKPIYSDVGSAVRYKIKVTLNNHDTFICTTQFTGYDYNKIYKLSDTEILNRLKPYKNSNDTITLFRKIQTINYPQGNKYYKYKYSACALEDIILINYYEIKSVKKISVNQAEHGNFEKEKSEAENYLIRYTSQIITYLTQSEINLLQNKPNSIHIINRHFDSYYCLSYNPKIGKNELKKMCNLFLENKNNLPNDAFKKLQKEHYKKKIKELKKHKVIIIYLWGYC